jgi:predicted amidophosphoribosyltransferase
MERMCSNCHAVLKLETAADWCPACGGALIERAGTQELDKPGGPPPEIDHRGIVLPRRHALGGIITPQ